MQRHRGTGVLHGRPIAATLIRAVDGRRTLGDIAELVGGEVGSAPEDWAAVDRELAGFNLMRYSRGAGP